MLFNNLFLSLFYLYSNLFVSLLLSLVLELLVLLVHQATHISIFSLSHVMFLDPDEASRRTIGGPVGVERPYNTLIVAIRVAELRNRILLSFSSVTVWGSIFFRDATKHVAIHCVKALVLVLFISIIYNIIYINYLFIVVMQWEMKNESCFMFIFKFFSYGNESNSLTRVAIKKKRAESAFFCSV